MPAVHSRILASLPTITYLAIFLPLHSLAGESSDKAKGAIIKAGGSIRRVSLDGNGLEVDFRLGGGKLTDEEMVHVGAVPNIVWLNLKGTKITSAGLMHLKRLQKLRSLHLEETNVDDAGIPHLLPLKNLEYLNLYGTKVTNKSLKHFAAMNKLRRLFLWRTKVTAKAVAAFKKQRPKLKVVLGDDLVSVGPTKPEKPPKVIKWIPADKLKNPRSVSGQNTEMIFENSTKHRIKIYWIKYGGGLRLYSELKPGGKHNQNTYARNTWLITDEKEKRLGYFVAEAVPVQRAIIPAVKK